MQLSEQDKSNRDSILSSLTPEEIDQISGGTNKTYYVRSFDPTTGQDLAQDNA